MPFKTVTWVSLAFALNKGTCFATEAATQGVSLREFSWQKTTTCRAIRLPVAANYGVAGKLQSCCSDVKPSTGKCIFNTASVPIFTMKFIVYFCSLTLSMEKRACFCCVSH